MTTQLLPPLPNTDTVSSLAVAEILRIRRQRASQHEKSTESLHEKKTQPRRPRLKKAMSERRIPTSLDMHLSSGGLGGGGGLGNRRGSFHQKRSLLSGLPPAEPEEDDKSFTSMGSFSSCGSNWTIGSTNSMDDKRRMQYKNRRAISERNLLGVDSDDESE